MFFIVDGSPLLGHGVSLVCPGQSPFVFFLWTKAKRLDQKVRIEKKIYCLQNMQTAHTTQQQQNKTKPPN